MASWVRKGSMKQTNCCEECKLLATFWRATSKAKEKDPKTKHNQKLNIPGNEIEDQEVRGEMNCKMAGEHVKKNVQPHSQLQK